MGIEDILTLYEEVKEDLKFQGMSSVRIKIMISLIEGPKKTKELRISTGIPSSTILHGISELEKQKLISRKGDNSFLSEIGKIITFKLVDIVKTLVTLKNNQKLWLNHEIDTIPHELLMEIGDLNNSQLIEAEYDDMFKTHGKHTQIMLNSKKLRGISPIFYSDYIETFTSIFNKNVNVELILTENILKKTIESHDPKNLENLKKLISEKKLKLWKIKEDVKFAFTITDKFITLGLFSKNGRYDSAKLLISDHEDAIKWGNKLFEYYLKKAERFNLDDLKNLN